jgi:hypothetical protein
MHADLKWLAENVSEWGGTYGFPYIFFEGPAEGYVNTKNGSVRAYTRDQWQAARNEIISPFSSPEEDEAWQAAEKRMHAIGHNGGTGEHYPAPEYDPQDVAFPRPGYPGRPASKYHVQIKGQWVDVYDILSAYGVTNPADAHAIKKMLCPGQRGAKDGIQDRKEAIVSLQRAIKLEGGL